MKFSDVEILLASASPRRRDLLQGLGWRFEICPASVDESLIAGESPEQAVLRLAQAKAQAMAPRFPRHLVIASDTVVALDGRVYGKPRSDQEALAMLKALSGRVHRVHSGLWLIWQGQGLGAVETTKVCFRRLSEEDLKAYVATGEHRGKAGAYAIQGLGALMVQSIEGDYSNVVGLPLALLGSLMERLGFSLTCLWEARP